MSDVLVDFLIVGGGGGGGDNQGGGGGAGGVISGTTRLTTNQSVIVGGGGVGLNIGESYKVSGFGKPSSLGTIVAAGGGHGGGWGGGGRDGGCGGGAMSGAGGLVGIGVSGTGYNGGAGVNAGFGFQCGGGGGGAGGTGFAGTTSPSKGGNGGIGIWSAITGSGAYYAGGGGGGADTAASGAGIGGIGGGGNGGWSGSSGFPATFYGGGGGGGSYSPGVGAAGYQGIVIVRYTTDNYINGSGGTITTDGTHTIHTFTTNGTFTLPISAIGIPSGLAITDTTGKSITLEWQDAPYPAVQTNIYRNTTNSSSSAVLAGATMSGTQIFISGGLQPSTLYYFWAKSMDSDGNLSAFSSGVSASTTSASEGPSAFVANRIVVGNG